jgi:hypothetical protein
MPAEQIIVPFPGPVSTLGVATKCKSTLIVSSVRAMKENGYMDAYAGHLDPRHKETVLACIAGTWVSIDVAIAHYTACNALGLAVPEQVRMGASVADRIHRSLLNTVVRLAAGAGADPWTALGHFHKFYERMFDRGGTSVVKVGPKDARVEIVGLPLASIPYFVNAYRGVIQAGGQLFGSRAFVTTLAKHASPTSVAFRIAWA